MATAKLFTYVTCKTGVPHGNRYTGYSRSSGSSDACATIVQILLRTKYFTDSLTQTSGAVFKLFRKLYEEMTNNRPWLDIDPLIKVDRSVLGGSCELTDCLSGLFRLLGSPIRHMTSPTGVIFHLPHGNSVTRYFSELGQDLIHDLGVIFFETRSVVLSDIPETLDRFSLYVVVTRLSKTKHRLCFQDSKGWLFIHDHDIEETCSFRRDNISLLGYILDLKFTNVFRCILNCNHVLRRPRRKLTSKPVAEVIQLESVQPEKDSLIFSHEIPQDCPHPRPKAWVSVVLWFDPEKSTWGSEKRESVLIESCATGDQLLNAASELFQITLDPSTSYEIIKIFPNLDGMKIISSTDKIDADDDDVFHIQPAIPARQSCPVVLFVGSNGVERAIDFRLICLSCGQLNLSDDVPQNSFRSIAATLVGGRDRILDISAVIEQSGVRSRESDGIFVLSPAICHVCIVVRYGCPVFDCLAAKRGDPEGEYNCGLHSASRASPYWDEAAKYYKRAADQNHAKAQFRYAACLSEALGVSVDRCEAAKYFKLVADRNHSEAQFRYAECVLEGRGVQSDFFEAVKYYKLAADQDHTAAKLRYVQCLSAARSAAVDLPDPVGYFRCGLRLFRGCDDPADFHSHLRVRFHHACCLATGLGVSIDLAKAAKYFKLAVDQNHSGSQLRYALCLLAGHGVQIDCDGAVECIRRALDRNPVYAQSAHSVGLLNLANAFRLSLVGMPSVTPLWWIERFCAVLVVPPGQSMREGHFCLSLSLSTFRFEFGSRLDQVYLEIDHRSRSVLQSLELSNRRRTCYRHFNAVSLRLRPKTGPDTSNRGFALVLPLNRKHLTGRDSPANKSHNCLIHGIRLVQWLLQSPSTFDQSISPSIVYRDRGIDIRTASGQPLVQFDPMVLVDQKLLSVQNCESCYSRVDRTWKLIIQISVSGLSSLTLYEEMQEMCVSAESIEFRRLRSSSITPVLGVCFDGLVRMRLVFNPSSLAATTDCYSELSSHSDSKLSIHAMQLYHEGTALFNLATVWPQSHRQSCFCRSFVQSSFQALTDCLFSGFCISSMMQHRHHSHPGNSPRAHGFPPRQHA
jgi:TPR repeat protein